MARSHLVLCYDSLISVTANMIATVNLYNMLAMNAATRNAIAEASESLASQQAWNSEVWSKCYDLVTASWENELVKYVHDDLIHYDGEFHSRNILGFRVKPNSHQLDDYRHEFRSIAADLSLADAKKQFGL